VEEKVRKTQTLGAKAKARKPTIMKHTTAASLRGAKIKFHFDADVVWAEANSSFDQGS